MSCAIVQDARSEVWVYPKDNYETPVDFSKAEHVSRDEVKFVNFDVDGKEVEASQLKNHPTKVLIHGWLTSILKSPWYPKLKDAYISEEAPINVIYVDYEGPASKIFSIAAPTSSNVAKIVAEYLRNTSIDLDNIHLIGHSLGSHVAGFVGRSIFNATGQKIGRITLLDPAGPKFDKSPERVSKEDAKFVDAIHSDDGHYGLAMSVGHIDVFPNGGKFQPGCPPLTEDDNCSHARSTLYYVESVKKRAEICWKAANWTEFTKRNYISNKPEVFGEYVSHSARGDYFFATNPTAPFL